VGVGALLGDALIVDAVRTPFGRHGGGLAPVRPDDLAALVLRNVLLRTGVPGDDIEDVILGCANQAGEDNRNVARMAALLAGLPDHVAGSTVNRLCGSGMDAIASAARAIALGEAGAYLAGGVESMSRAPFVVPKPSRAYPTGAVEMVDTTLGWRLVNPRMEELGHTDSLGQTAENLAREHGITRAEQDAFALHSHAKAVTAADAGRFADELVPVDVPGRKESVRVEADEVPRRDTSLESLGRLQPAFVREGTVTAGNSSTLNDGAGAVLLTSREYAHAHGLAPLARVRSIAIAGVPPRIMGIGPVPAAAKALARAGLTLDDMGLVEVNEAFAAQVLAVLREWDMDPEDDRLNVNGGAIALGHPLGASGARIVATTVHELRRRGDVQFALVSMCIGVGQGIALVLERV
jgi:acetyl-CoA acyltransferase